MDQCGWSNNFTDSFFESSISTEQNVSSLTSVVSVDSSPRFSNSLTECLLLARSLPNKVNELSWLNTVLAVCEYMSFVKSWQEKGCNSQAETWQVKNILMKDFDHQVKCNVFVVSMAT